MVKKPTHISGSLIEQLYIKKAFLGNIFTNVTVENICAVRIAIEKNSADFYIIPYNLI